MFWQNYVEKQHYVIGISKGRIDTTKPDTTNNPEPRWEQTLETVECSRRQSTHDHELNFGLSYGCSMRRTQQSVHLPLKCHYDVSDVGILFRVSREVRAGRELFNSELSFVIASSEIGFRTAVKHYTASDGSLFASQAFAYNLCLRLLHRCLDNILGMIIDLTAYQAM